MALHLDKLHEKQVGKCWDLFNELFLNKIFLFFHQIQSICWHPIEAQNLLSASSDQTVCLVDCRDANNKTSQHRWTFDSDVERVTWNTFDTNQFLVRIKRDFFFSFKICYF